MKKENHLYFTECCDGDSIPIDKRQLFEQIPYVWIPIVDKLVDNLFNAGWSGHVDQIKEKYGYLRFYIPSGNDEIFNLINEAEAATGSICIVCGEPATTSTMGWVTYVCDNHKDRR